MGRRAFAMPKTSFPQLNSDLSHFYRTWDTAVEGYNVAIVTVSKARGFAAALMMMNIATVTVTITAVRILKFVL
jgi:hypothetical protein